MTPDVFEPIVARLQGEPRRYFGASHATVAPVSVQTRRTSRLLLVSVNADGRTFEAYVKVCHPGNPEPDALDRLRARMTRDYAVTTQVHMALTGDDQLAAVQPIAVFPDEMAIVTRRAAGIPLSGALEQASWRPHTRSLDALLDALRTVGRWQSRFQKIGEPIPERQDLGVTLDYIDVRLHKLMAAGSLTTSDRGRVRRWLMGLWGDIPSASLGTVPIHADYCLGNVLVDGRRIVVLDFAMARQGAKYHDLAHMYMHLQLLRVKPWFRPAVVDALCAALLEGYAPGLRADDPLFRLLLAQHVINHLTKLTIRPPRRVLARPMNWMVRRQHLASLREHGCLAPSAA
jgi:hypothetical protein